MQKIERRPILPIGDGGKLERQTDRNKKERTLLFAPVKNKVIMVNPNIHAPLRLTQGEPSPLGLFAIRENIQPDEGEIALEVMYGHSRSALITRALFSDSEGRIYRDIDLKGAGAIYKDSPRSSPFAVMPGAPRESGNREGLLEKEFAFHDYELSEEFLRVGIRTHRVIGIIRLWEVLLDTEKVSLRGNSKFTVLDEGLTDWRHFRSVIQVRAFGTKARVQEASDNLLYKDAKKMVSQELGYKRTITDKEYFEWFAKTLGENVGIMHRNGWTHRYLSSHNVTLDCRIVDLDSVGYDLSEREEDVSQARNTIAVLIDHQGHGDVYTMGTYLAGIFNKSYQEAAFSH